MQMHVLCHQPDPAAAAAGPGTACIWSGHKTMPGSESVPEIPICG